MLAYFKPEWNAVIGSPLRKKLSTFDYPLSIENIFPWKEELSNGIDYEKFCESFLIQPDLFLRIRPGHTARVLRKLTDGKIDFRMISESCVVLANSTKLEGVIELNKEAVIQDYNSQQIAGFFQPQTISYKPQASWDCCAASGGKSIMLHDLYPELHLTVSDIRESILVNLKKRFAEAGIKKYNSFVTDLSTAGCKLPTDDYDLIIADVPCTGSGTWSRTPESLCFFESNEIERYSSLQKKIISNIIPKVNSNGILLYITCSVFKKENEEMANFISQKFKMKLLVMKVLSGYSMRADSMFAASFTRQ